MKRMRQWFFWGTFSIMLAGIYLQTQVVSVMAHPVLADETSDLLKREHIPSIGQLRGSLMQTTTVFLPVVSHKKSALPFGTQIYFNPAQEQTGLNRLIESETSWIRVPVRWNQIEPANTTPNNYNWAYYDSLFLSAKLNGIRVIGTIGDNPPWAAETGGGPLYPGQVAGMVEFVGALAERYDGDGYQDAAGAPIVNIWEFYNEPDNTLLIFADIGWGYWGYQGAAYASLMAEVYPAVKAANFNTAVAMGGIAYDNFTDQQGPFYRGFIDDFLAAGGANFIDFVNFHSYPYFASNWVALGPDVIGKTNSIRQKLAANGQPNKPIIITEIGITSEASSRAALARQNNFEESDEAQSRYVVQGNVRALAAAVRLTIWFNFNDLPSTAFGLTDETFSPKLAFTAFQTLVKQLGRATYQRSLNAVELNAAQSEGYVFTRGAETIYVLWNNQNIVSSMKIRTTSVNRINKFGHSLVITDAQDGVSDGWVTIYYDGSPLYLIWKP